MFYLLLFTGILFSQPAVSGEFSGHLQCLKSLQGEGVFLSRNRPGFPGSLITEGYMLQRTCSGQSGFYLFKEDTIYFVPVPFGAKQITSKEYPSSPPAIFLWAEIPNEDDLSLTHAFMMTVQKGRIVSWQDEIGYQLNIEMGLGTDRTQDLTHTQAIDVSGPESSELLTSVVISALRVFPENFLGMYQALDEKSAEEDPTYQPIPPSGYKGFFLSQLEECVNTVDPRILYEIDAAKRRVESIPEEKTNLEAN